MSRLIVSRGRRWSFRAVGVILIAFGLILRVSDPFPVQAARLVYFDYLQRLSPREYTPNLPVKVVDIDETSLAELGQWPWPRTLVAQMVDRLAQLGAAVIVFDTLFAEPDRYSPARLAEDPVFAELLGDPESFAGIDNDQRLAGAIGRVPTVLGVAVRSGSALEQPSPRAGIIEIGEQPASGLVNVPVWTGLAAPLGDYATGIGAINVSPDVGTGLVRQVPLVWNGPTGVMPSISIEALRLALQEHNIFVEGALDEPGIVLNVGLGSFTIPTTENGQIWVRFRRDHPDLYVSAHEVLTGSDEMALREKIEGRIILIGTSAAGLLDIRETALGDSVPGVSIHAQIIEQILLNEVLERSDITAALELLAFLSLGLILMSVMLLSGAVLSLVSGAVGSGVVLAISWFAFQSNATLFDATFPLLGGLMTFGALASFQFIVADHDKKAIRTSLSHYVAPEILDEIERTGHNLELGGETQEITVMFADIRDFTPISESMSATELVSLLNEMFESMGAEILAERGTIDKFIGDSIMAFWNAPVPIDDHPLRAAIGALRMRSALERFNKLPIMENRPPISIAIGLAAGEACVGNIGSRDRFNYTVIGDVVNVAARIENVCRRAAYDIVISDSVCRASKEQLAILDAGMVPLKGKSQLAPIYIVVGDQEMAQSEAFARLHALHTSLIPMLRDKSNGELVASVMAECTKIAAEIEPGLVAFYDAILSRREDFANPIDDAA